MNEEEVINRIRGSVASKMFGNEDVISRIIARACIGVSSTNINNFPSEHVRVAKILGGGIEDSMVINGMVIVQDSNGSIKSVRDSKVAVYAQSIENFTTESNGTILLQQPDDLLNYTKDEETRLEQIVKGIVKSGVGTVVCGSSFSDLSQYLFNKYGIMIIHVSSKFDLQRICHITGSCALVRNEPPTNEELGYAKKIQVREIGGTKCIVIEQDTISSNLTTIVLRGATSEILDDMERAVATGVNTYKILCKDSRVVPGGGATEMEIARHLTSFAGSETGLEQYAIQKFAEALEVIPRTLAENSGLCAIRAVSTLWTAHSIGLNSTGLDIESGGAVDLSKKGVVDIFLVKSWALKILSDVVITVLKIDHIIMAKQAMGQETETDNIRNNVKSHA